MKPSREFEYHATDSSGKPVAGTVTGPDRESAVDALRDKGLHLLSLSEKSASKFGSDLYGRIRGQDFVSFNEHLASMTKSGMPLPESLSAIAADMEDQRFKSALEDVLSDVRGGHPLTHALRRRDDVYSDLYIRLVQAGEASGNLSSVLTLIARQSEGSLKVKRQIRDALLYPTVVLVVLMGLYVCLSLHVVPGFEAMYADIEKDLRQAAGTTWQPSPLPPVTRFVLVAMGPPVMVTVCGLAILALGWLWFVAPRTAFGRKFLEKAVLQVPFISNIARSYEISRVFKTLSILVQGGVPLPDALQIVAESSPNKWVAKGMAHALSGISEGKRLSESLRDCGTFPRSLTWRIAMSEVTNDVPKAFTDIADVYQRNAEQAASRLNSVLEPALIVFAGVVSGLTVTGLFLPLIEIMQRLGGP